MQTNLLTIQYIDVRRSRCAYLEKAKPLSPSSINFDRLCFTHMLKWALFFITLCSIVQKSFGIHLVMIASINSDFFTAGTADLMSVKIQRAIVLTDSIFMATQHLTMTDFIIFP